MLFLEIKKLIFKKLIHYHFVIFYITILFFSGFFANAGFLDSLGGVVSKVAEVALPVAGVALSASAQAGAQQQMLEQSIQMQQNYQNNPINNSDGFGKAESQNINMILDVQQQILQIAQQISNIQQQMNNGWPAAEITISDYNKILPIIKESLPVIQKNLPFIGNFEPQIKRITSLIASINDYMLQIAYALNMMQSQFNRMNFVNPCFQQIIQPPNFSQNFITPQQSFYPNVNGYFRY